MLKAKKINPKFATYIVVYNDILTYGTLITVPLLIATFAQKAYTDIKELILQISGFNVGAMVLLLFFSGSFYPLKKSKQSLLFFFLFLFYLFVNALSSLFAENFSESFILLKNLAAYFLVSWWIFLRANDEDFIKRLLSIISATVGIIAIYGLLQYVGYDFIRLEIGRSPVSTLGNLNFVAQFYLASLPFAALALFLSQGSLSRYFSLSVLILALFHFLLTHSRGGYLGFISALLLFLFLYLRLLGKTSFNFLKPVKQTLISSRSWIILSCVILISFSFLFLERGESLKQFASIFHQEQESNRYRLLTWKSTLKMVADYPILGVGVGNFRFNFSRYKSPELWELQDPWGKIRQIRTHNDYLNILAETGIIGFLSFVVLVFFVLFNALKTKPEGELLFAHYSLLRLSAIAAIIATLTQSLFDFNLYNTPSALYFWMAMAIAARPTSVNQLRAVLSVRRRGIFFLCLLLLIVSAFVVNLSGFRRFISSVYLRRGEVLEQRRLILQALQNYERAQAIFPHNIDAIAAEADLLRESNNFPSATVAYKKWLKEEPYFIPIYNSLGYCYIKLNNYQLAYDVLNLGLKFYPSSPVLLNNMANLLFLMKDYSKALQYYRRANETPNPFSKENQLNFIRALLKTGDYSEAIGLLRNLHQEQPDNLQVLQLLAEVAYQLRHFEEAKALYLRLWLLSPKKLGKNSYQRIEQINAELMKEKNERQKD